MALCTTFYKLDYLAEKVICFDVYTVINSKIVKLNVNIRKGSRFSILVNVNIKGLKHFLLCIEKATINNYMDIEMDG